MAWNLADLFTSVQEYESSKGDLAQLLAERADEKRSSESIEFLEELSTRFELLEAYIALSLAHDRSNTYYSNEEQSLLLLNTKIKNIKKQLVRNSDKLSGSDKNIVYAFFVSRLKRVFAHQADEKTESMISDMERINGENWTSLRKIELQKLRSTDDQSLCVIQARQLESEDAVRQNSLLEEIKMCRKAEEVSCRALNAIKAENNMVSKARGHSSAMDMVLHNEGIPFCFISASLASMGKVSKNILSGIAKKQSRIGTDSFKWYNINYISHNQKTLPLSFENAIEVIKKAFHRFHPEAGKMVERSVSHNLINYEKVETKRSGAFCTNVTAKKSTYLMLTYSENLRSYISLAHELGHGFHYSLMNKHGYLANAAPTTLKESVAHLFEILACQELCIQYPEHCQQIYEMQLTSLASTWIDVQSRYLFEKEVFERCSDHYFTPEELTQLMLSKQKEIIGDYENEDAYNPTTWISKPHFYYSEKPYYNFPYMIGRLLSYYLYGRIKDDANFTNELISMLETSGMCLFSESLNKIGINETAPDWSRSENEIVSVINQFSSSINKSF